MGWAAEIGIICCGKAISAPFVGSSRGQMARSKRRGPVGNGEARLTERSVDRRMSVNIVSLVTADSRADVRWLAGQYAKMSILRADVQRQC